MPIVVRELRGIWSLLLLQFTQIGGYWIFGMLTGSLLSVFGKNWLFRAALRLNQNRGHWGILFASLLGIASPLCMYGTVPIAASLAKNGLREDWIASFMMSSILLNPQLLIYSAALGSRALLLRFASCLAGGALAGMAVRLFYREKRFFRFAGFHVPASRDTDPVILWRLVKNVGRNIRATLPYFMLGILLSAIYQRYAPQQLIADLFASQRGFGTLLAATLGVPLYVCGGGTIPLLLSWLDAGMSMGAAVAYMISGPATKITNLGAVKIVLGGRRFLYYLLFAVGYSVLSGLAVNLLFR